MRGCVAALLLAAGCQGLRAFTPPGAVCSGDDCASPDEVPGAEDCADDLDNDDNGQTDCEDEACAPVCDADGDGFIDEARGGDDCDDAAAAVNPSKDEVCDEVDNDCDGHIDDEDSDVTDVTVWYADQDGDGYGDPLISLAACDSGGLPSSTQAGDCNDSDDTVSPGLPEVACDGFDNDCTTLTSDNPDADGDGSGACADCNDAIAAIHPGAADTCGDSIDSDCDGQDCGLFDDDFEGGSPLKPAWSSVGAEWWDANSVQHHGGQWSAASGNIGDNELSTLELTLDWSRPGSITFWVRVDTEDGYDLLEFVVDGTVRDTWSGDRAWARQSYTVSAGVHELKWRYDKDRSESHGADRVWIDDVVAEVNP